MAKKNGGAHRLTRNSPFDSVLVVDFETTGVKWPYYAVEVAWIQVDRELNQIRHRTSLIKPPISIPREVTAIHGISDRDVEDSPSLEEFVIEECNNPFESHHVCFVAHNAVFDFRLFQPFCKSAKLLCTVAAARRVYTTAANFKLETLAATLGLDDTTAHRALADAQTCLALLRSVQQGTGLDLDSLCDFSDPYRKQDSLPFGKYRGTPITNVPGDYLHWLYARLEDDDPITPTLSAELDRRGRREP